MAPADTEPPLTSQPQEHRPELNGRNSSNHVTSQPNGSTTSLKDNDTKQQQPVAPTPVRRSTLSRLLHRDEAKDEKAEPVPAAKKESGNTSAKATPATTPAASRATTPANQQSDPLNGFTRFEMLPDGSHVHHFALTKRKEKLSNLFKDWMHKGEEKAQNVALGDKGQLSLVQDFVEKKQKGYYGKESTSLVQKYGKCQEIIGKGAFGVVRVSHKTDQGKEKLFAIKEFKKRANESAKKFTKRLTSEFCISSSLHHNNVIETLDLIQDAKGEYCEVMEYCAGGDLYSLILASGKLQQEEAFCFFGQMMRGVAYLHEMGVAHRDLKPENLLLTSSGTLKITDFGNGECFRMAWEKEAHKTRGLCGSAPYIAPEEYTDDEFDPRAVDVWATGVIYMAMVTGRHLWRQAKGSEDEYYERYVEERKSENGFEPIQKQPKSVRKVIYAILEPSPEKRATVKDILASEWYKSIQFCKAAAGVGVVISGEKGVALEVSPKDGGPKVSKTDKQVDVSSPKAGGAIAAAAEMAASPSSL